VQVWGFCNDCRNCKIVGIAQTVEIAKIVEIEIIVKTRECPKLLISMWLGGLSIVTRGTEANIFNEKCRLKSQVYYVTEAL